MRSLHVLGSHPLTFVSKVAKTGPLANSQHFRDVTVTPNGNKTDELKNIGIDEEGKGEEQILGSCLHCNTHLRSQLSLLMVYPALTQG